MRFLVVFCFFIVFGCSAGPTQKNRPESKPPVTERVKTVGLEMSIQGMTCTGCEQTIQSGLSSLKGVKQVKANYRNGKAYVEFEAGVGDTVKMRESVTASGYVLASIKTIPLDSLRSKR